MPFRNDGEGLHRSVDPADGKHYVYGMCFMDAAPTIFACFDQPDLKAPYTFHVRAPQDWVVIGNAPGRQVEQGVWEFEQSQPLSTYFVTARGRPLPRDPRRARRHPARPQRPGQHRGRPRQGRRRAVHADPAELRRAAPAVRHPLPVRRLPPGVRAGVQRRRDGEPGLRHLPRPADLHQPGHAGHPDRPGQHPRPRDGAPVVRQPRHARPGGTTCGSTSRSPSTWATGSPPTSPSTPTCGSTTPTPGASGGWSPTSGRAPTRWPATARSTPARRCRTSTASPTPRAARSCASSTPRSATRCSSRAPSTTSSGTGSATPRCTTCSRAGSAPAPATCRASPTTGCAPPART